MLLFTTNRNFGSTKCFSLYKPLTPSLRCQCNITDIFVLHMDVSIKNCRQFGGILSQERQCFRSPTPKKTKTKKKTRRVKAGPTVLPPQSKESCRGSCSPRGWASCLLEMPGAFLWDALSAEAGLCLWSLCQGEYSDRAELVKKLLLNLTLCSSTQGALQCYVEKQTSSFEAKRRDW